MTRGLNTNTGTQTPQSQKQYSIQRDASIPLEINNTVDGRWRLWGVLRLVDTNPAQWRSSPSVCCSRTAFKATFTATAGFGVRPDVSHQSAPVQVMRSGLHKSKDTGAAAQGPWTLWWCVWRHFNQTCSNTSGGGAFMTPHLTDEVLVYTRWKIPTSDHQHESFTWTRPSNSSHHWLSFPRLVLTDYFSRFLLVTSLTFLLVFFGPYSSCFVLLNHFLLLLLCCIYHKPVNQKTAVKLQRLLKLALMININWHLNIFPMFPWLNAPMAAPNVLLLW